MGAVTLGPGWLLYLFAGASGGPARGKTNHFIVPNGLFSSSKVLEVHLSTLGVILMFFVLFKLGQIYTFSFIFMMYFPFWWVSFMWLSAVTLLQHVS